MNSAFTDKVSDNGSNNLLIYSIACQGTMTLKVWRDTDTESAWSTTPISLWLGKMINNNSTFEASDQYQVPPGINSWNPESGSLFSFSISVDTSVTPYVALQYPKNELGPANNLLSYYVDYSQDDTKPTMYVGTSESDALPKETSVSVGTNDIYYMYYTLECSS